MPYGCAKHSLPGGPTLIKARGETQTTASGLQYVPIDMDNHEGRTAIMAPKDLLERSLSSGMDALNVNHMMLIPYRSRLSLAWFGSRHAATPEQIHDGAYGLSIAYAGDIGGTEMLDFTCILCCPGIIQRLAYGENPQGMDTRQLAKLKELGQVYRPPPASDQALVRPSNFGASSGGDPVCVVCMAYPPQFLWEKCGHPREGRQKLVCHKCCNELRRRARGNANAAIRGTGYIRLPCFICQTVSRLV